MGKTHGFTIEDIGDRKYDAEYMNDFIDDLCNDLDTYDERASRLADGYQRYHDNETYVGEAADASKKFIYDVQYDELHMKYHNLQRDFLNACIRVEEKFRNNVDSSSRARISEEVLLKIKETFKRYQRAIDDYGFQLEGLGKYAVGNYGKRWGISMIPNYLRVMVAYEEFCGDGGFLDKCILKLREFDKDADSYLKGTGIKEELYELQKAIRNLAVILDSAKVDQPDVEKTTINLLSMNSVNAKAMTVGLWPFSKKPSIDVVKANAEKNNVKYIESMREIYGFSEEESVLLNDAYIKYCEKETISGNRENINHFYSALASLYPGYSSDSKLFNYMGDNKLSPNEAISYFNSIGVDGQALYDAINKQHSECGKNEKRDFAHECAIYSVMANDGVGKSAATMYDDVDALVGFKGDIYSGRMGDDDIKSDISAYNIYHRMKACKDKDIWNAMVNYNIDACDGTINESKEFLEKAGFGNEKLGMVLLKKTIDKTSVATDYIMKTSDANQKMVDEKRQKFLEHLSDESGVDY